MKNAREGDFSILRVWVALEARKFMQGSIEDVSIYDGFLRLTRAYRDQVERCVKYDLLSPNI